MSTGRLSEIGEVDEKAHQDDDSNVALSPEFIE